MEIGLLWYDDDPHRGLEDKVERAAQRYREKYGRWPNTCFVHAPAVAHQATEGTQMMCGSKGPQKQVRLIPAPNILRHHYWVGESVERAERKTGLSAS